MGITEAHGSRKSLKGRMYQLAVILNIRGLYQTKTANSGILLECMIKAMENNQEFRDMVKGYYETDYKQDNS